MATLAEQRKDDRLTGKEEGTSLNTSKADGHISTQESMSENNRESKVLAQNISISERRPDLYTEAPVESRAECSAVDTTAKNDVAIKKHPFILSSRAEFDESNMFAAARNRTNEKFPVDQDASIRDYFNVTNRRAEDQDYNTPPNSNRLRVQTPQSKKAKYIFKRTFDATFNPSSVRGTDIILASDSGEEDV